jgi:hypothetical protein
MKKSHLRAAAVLVCAAFLLSMAPVLQSAEKKAVKPSLAASLRDSIRVLAAFVPFLAPLAELTKKDGRNEDLENPDTILNPLLPRPTTDSPSPGEPRTKD